MRKLNGVVHAIQHKSNKLFMSYNDFNLICDMQFCDSATTQSACRLGWYNGTTGKKEIGKY